MKNLLLIFILIGTSIFCYAKIEKYYIRNIEISKEEYLALTALSFKNAWNFQSV